MRVRATPCATVYRRKYTIYVAERWRTNENVHVPMCILNIIFCILWHTHTPTPTHIHPHTHTHTHATDIAIFLLWYDGRRRRRWRRYIDTFCSIADITRCTRYVEYFQMHDDCFAFLFATKPSNPFHPNFELNLRYESSSVHSIHFILYEPRHYLCMKSICVCVPADCIFLI